MDCCDRCRVEVVDGVSGTVSQSPWSDERIVTCYGCENEAMLEADRIQYERAAEAEDRYRARTY